MKRKTLMLRAVVFLIGIAVLALCFFGLPSIFDEAAANYPKSIYLPIFIGMYASAIPFFAALFQALRLLRYIDDNSAFSDLSVKALHVIKYCACAISLLYVACLPFLYRIADQDDAPGVLAIGLVVAFAAFVIAVFAAVLQKLLQNAIDIKSENDLTI
ncbi:DUF2975 domain-containing protein [Cohnella sp. GbtcB17]|uniref:DUF2975 domain-containing protein n=1 Tax=Cohnella sp. GbtcB17 TaxID=2824762 RepID=UPI001C2F428C|nr:DUF2975 domain-containing protein [Cohnella sp. GbtcB17]